MDHLEASRSQAAEKYLLDQLEGKARDDFEEHFFECAICAEDVRTGVLLLDNAAAEFHASPLQSPVHGKRRSWLDSFRINWRQPAFALPILALAAVSALWMRDHQSLSAELNEPQSFTSVSAEHTRGAQPLLVSRDGKSSAISFYIEPDRSPGYTFHIEGNGVAPATVHFKQNSRDTPYNILLPSARYRPGEYHVTITGDSGVTPVEQFTLDIK